MKDPLESEIKAGILKYLRALPQTYVRNLQIGYIPGRTNTAKGMLDLCVIHRGNVHWLEVKRPGGKTSKEQDEFILAWRACGGSAHVVYCLEDVMQILGEKDLFTRQAQEIK